MLYVSKACLALLAVALLASGAEPAYGQAPPRPDQDVNVVNEAPIPIEVTNPITVAPAVEGRIEFLGFSTSTLRGGAGWVVKNEICQFSFPGSRACTTEDMANTPRRPACVSTGGVGWVRPSVVGVGLSPGFIRDSQCNGSNPPDDCDSLRPVVVDKFTGASNSTGRVVFPGNLSCGGIAASPGGGSGGEDGWGLVMGCSGELAVRQCGGGSEAPVACCGVPQAQQP